MIVEANPTDQTLPLIQKTRGADEVFFDAFDANEIRVPAETPATIPSCTAAIEQEAADENPWRLKWTLLERDGLWPSSGPDFGGGQVLLLPRTAAARRAELGSCRFGTSVRAAGYSAFSGLVTCAAPPRVHVVRPGDTLRAVADRHGQPVDALLALNPALRGREAALAIGEALALQEAEVAVELLDPRGEPLPGERAGMRYRYFPLRVDAVSPRSVPVEGGTVVTVRGAGFRPFGRAPAGSSAGAGSAGVGADGGEAVLAAAGAGGAGGACPVRCRFGGRAEAAAEVVSATEVRCVAPPLPTAELEEGDPGPAGVAVRTVAVEVTANGADYTRAGRRLTYRRRLLCIPPPPPPAAPGAAAAAAAPPPPPMLIVAVPRAFEGEAAGAQRAALRSWAALRPRPRILLVGRDAGVAAAAAAHGAEHAPGVRVGPEGTPLLDSVLEEAEARFAGGRPAGGRRPGGLIVLVNADIVLFDDLPLVARRAAAELGPVLVVGRRTSANATLAALAAAPAAGRRGAGGRRERRRLRRLARGGGGWAAEHSRWALDYFAFTPGLWLPGRPVGPAAGGRTAAAAAAHPNASARVGVPPFAVGRPGLDNWLVRRAVELGRPVVDASAAVVALHPPHSRAHARAAPAGPAAAAGAEWARAVRGGAPARDVWETLRSAEIARNLALAGPGAKLGTADHATWVALPCRE